MPIVLVTGTDTGAGKTFVTAAIVAALTARGERFAVVKAVETGCRTADGGLRAADGEVLAAAADLSVSDVCVERLAEPLAPAIAGEREGRTIDVESLVATLGERARAVPLLLVEGAGGLRVPITVAFDFADLARALDASVLVVVGSRLGALNHALLTFDALAARGIRVCGYVLNDLAPQSDLAVATNGSLLERVTDVRSLGTLPWVEDAEAVLAGLRARGPTTMLARRRLADLGARLDLEAIRAG
jgi:dethiobiotin synthetase